MLGYKSIVSIISIVVYATLGTLAAWLLLRKSFGSIRPWVFLVFFCILRIVGDGFQLSVDNTSSNPKKGILTAAAICSSIGLGPLLIIATQVLRQANAYLFNSSTSNQTQRALATFDLCVVVSTILAIQGGITSFDPDYGDGAFDATPTLQGSICLYAGSFFCIQLAALFIFRRRTRFQAINQGSPRSFNLVITLMLVALCLLLVRLIYGLILVFGSIPKFSPFNGDETVSLCMQVIEEWLVTIIYCAIGLITRRMAPPERIQGDKTDEPRSLRRFLTYVPLVHWFIR